MITTLDDSKFSILYQSQEMVDQNSCSRHRFNCQVWIKTESLSSTLNVSDADALSVAKQRLAQFSTTSVRIDGLIVNPLSDTSLWTQALTKELGDKITIKSNSALQQWSLMFILKNKSQCFSCESDLELATKNFIWI